MKGEIDPNLLSCPLFHDIRPELAVNILNSSNRHLYPKGTILIRKDSVPRALFIVAKGNVGIYNEDVLLATLGPMSMLGESFLAQASASATIRAEDGLEVIEIPQQLFLELSLEHPQLILNIFRINFERLRQSNEVALHEARTREVKLEQQVNERTVELNEALHRLQNTNAELSETRDHLIEIQKYRQQFLANMSHEIRTPMNAIVGLTNLLMKTNLSEQQEKYLDVIRKSGANLLVIINDILDVAKIESGKMELECIPFPLVNTINSIHTILGIKAQEKGIALKTEIDPGVPEYVLGDETRMTQIIINLAGNAIKFTEKGNVTISATVEKSDPVRPVIRFSVKDTGIGIPQDKLVQIFESFGQAASDTTRKYGGTGLGLTISKQLVELHGGSLHVTSTLGVGSEFYFSIPYTVCTKPNAEAHVSERPSENLADKRILLVEDNEFNQMVAVDSIMDLFPDITVDVASGGKEALELLKNNTYSFVFMDIQMPEMDGYETTRRIRAMEDPAKSHIRICAMTANVTREEIEECAAAGMDDFMIKPFTTDLLREKVVRNIQPRESVHK